DKMFKQFVKIVNSCWAVPSRGKVKSLIDKGFEQICFCLQDDLNKAETVSLIANLWTRTARDNTSINSRIQAQYQLKEKNGILYIEILASLLTIQQKKDAITNRKCLKAIMITEDEWTAVANIINILKPFNDITNYIS
ncbi:8914_t:CDS:2, partial [Gigaspora rosea]